MYVHIYPSDHRKMFHQSMEAGKERHQAAGGGGTQGFAVVVVLPSDGGFRLSRKKDISNEWLWLLNFVDGGCV